jgi:hypothetical protein
MFWFRNPKKSDSVFSVSLWFSPPLPLSLFDPLVLPPPVVAGAGSD